MYHYVRELANSRYPAIKGITAAQFAGQLDWLQAHHTMVVLPDVIAALDGQRPLPDNAALLTFDDGYLEHFTVVFPELANRGLSGAFFPPVVAVRERVLLSTNKVHILLAAAPIDDLLTACQRWMADHASNYPEMASYDTYFAQLAVPNRFDPGEVIFLKRLLQRELPEPARTALADALLEQVVGVPAHVLAAEWYMSEAQLRVMLANGMSVGAHGFSHRWLPSLTAEEQREELRASQAFLDDLGVARAEQSLNYPYGAFDDTTVAIAGELGFPVGFSTEVRVARVSGTHLGGDHRLTLPRLDTVDLPFSLQV